MRVPQPPRAIRGAVVLTVVLSAAAAPAAVAQARRAVSLTAVLTLSRDHSVVGQPVVAHLGRSLVPRGDSLRSIVLRWGDGTGSRKVSGLGRAPAHRYPRPGTYTVTLTLTDTHGRSVHATRTETVRAPGNRRASIVYIRPDTEALGPLIGEPARVDPLLRDSIVYLTCLHELGHALGLEHTSDFRDIMYFFGYGGDIVEYFSRYRRQLKSRDDIPSVSGLSEQDILRVRALHPSGTP